MNEQVVYVMDRLPLAEEMPSFSSLVLAMTHPLLPLLAIEDTMVGNHGTSIAGYKGKRYRT